MPSIGLNRGEVLLPLEEMGFNVFHRRDGVNIEEQIVQTNQVFPDLAFAGDKIETLSVTKLRAGTITSQIITLEVLPGAGDVYFAAGKTDFTNTDPGFILGIDDSDGDKSKFYIGNSTEYLNWDGTNLTINGSFTATSGTIGGWTINADTITGGSATLDSDGIITLGTGDDVVVLSSVDATWRLWVGDSTATDAPFRVDKDGNAVVNSVTSTISATVNPVVSLTAGEAIAAGNCVRIHTDGKVYKTTSITASLANSTLGFAPNAISAAAAGNIQLSQKFVTSGLSAGNIYYITDGTLDQSNEPGAVVDDGVVTNDLNAVYGQTFTTGGGVVKLDWIQLYGRKGVGGVSFRIDIFATSAGAPTGAALGSSATLAAADLTAANGWNTLYFTTPVVLSAGTLYAMVATYVSGGAGNNFTWVGSNSSVYANGTPIFYDGTWHIQTDDLYFRTAFSDGTISTTPGTVTKKIGISLSSTDLFTLNS